MIARRWAGTVPNDRLAAYTEILERTGLSEYRATEGNLGAELWTRDLGDGTSEVVTLSWWVDLDHVVAFAGEPVDAAHYYPEDDGMLLDPRADTVEHYEVTRRLL